MKQRFSNHRKAERFAIATEISDTHKANAGSTSFLHGRYEDAARFVSGLSHAYAVSAHKDRERVQFHNPTEREIREYWTDNEDLISLPHNALGTWFDAATGRHVLDVVTVELDLTQAVTIAREARQDAIFDLVTFAEIPVAATEAAAAC